LKLSVPVVPVEWPADGATTAAYHLSWPDLVSLRASQPGTTAAGVVETVESKSARFLGLRIRTRP
jgi:hypothetical protein